MVPIYLRGKTRTQDASFLEGKDFESVIGFLGDALDRLAEYISKFHSFFMMIYFIFCNSFWNGFF